MSDNNIKMISIPASTYAKLCDDVARYREALQHIAFGSLEKTFHEITEMTDAQIALKALEND